MELIDSVLISTLDLVNHPDNASNYGVVIFGEVIANPSAGSKGPTCTPKTLQLVSALPIANEALPPALKQMVDKERIVLRSFGGPKGCLVLPLMWSSHHSPHAAGYLTRWAFPETIEAVRNMRQLNPSGQRIPVTPERMIQ